MKGIKRLLVPIDFYECSEAAFNMALDIAKDKKGEIILLYVIDTELIDKLSSLGASKRSEIKHGMEMKASEGFERLHKKMRRRMKGVKVKELIDVGIPFVQILKNVKELSADLIVIGSFGSSSPMSRLFFGSTAEKVLRGARVPVLCVPPPEAIEG